MQVILEKRESKFLCRRDLSFYSRQNVSPKHKQRCEQQETTNARTYVKFTPDNEIDKFEIDSKTINIYKKNPVYRDLFLCQIVNIKLL